MEAFGLALRERVLAGLRDGLTQCEVARRVGVAPTTVQNYLKLWKTTGSLVPRPHGHPRKVLNAGDLAVLRQLRKDDPAATAEVLAGRLAERCGVRAGVSTIKRVLASMGIGFHRRRHGPLAPRSRGRAAKPYKVRPGRVLPTPPHRKAYTTDLTDAEWELLEPFVPKCKPGGRPETWPRRELVNAMLYILRNGNAWRALPHDLPPWKTVYYYFRKWRKSGLWQEINARLHTQARRRAGRGLAPTAAILDSQSAHTTERGGPTAGMATNA